MGVSRQRVHQLAKARGLASRAMEQRRTERLDQKRDAYKTEQWYWVKEEFEKQGVKFELRQVGKKVVPYANDVQISLRKPNKETGPFVTINIRKEHWLVAILKRSWTIYPPTAKGSRCVSVDPTRGRGPSVNIPFAKRIIA